MQSDDGPARDATTVPTRALSRWYLKPQATFSDCLARVRRTIWAEGNDVNLLADQNQRVISRLAWKRVLAQLQLAATA